MNFKALTGTLTEEVLQKDYDTAEKVGPLKLGKEAVYQSQLLRVNYIPYCDVQWVFRRIEGCTTKMCCGTQGIDIYHYIIVADGRQCLDVRSEDKNAFDIFEEKIAKYCPGADIGFTEELKEKYKKCLVEAKN